MTDSALRLLPSFSDLRHLRDTNPVAHACIEIRKAELCSRDWDIVPEDPAGEFLAPWNPQHQELADQRAAAVKFFRRPDPDHAGFTSWFRVALEESLTTDCLAIYLALDHRQFLSQLRILDSSHIEPGFDTSGHLCEYRQYLHEVPRRPTVDLVTKPTPDPVSRLPASRMRYYLFSPNHPFGCSPLERAMQFAAEDNPSNPQVQTAHLLQAFWLPAAALGITISPPDRKPLDGPGSDAWRVQHGYRWADRRLRWFKDIFDNLLGEGSGLQWKWDDDRVRDGGELTRTSADLEAAGKNLLGD